MTAHQGLRIKPHLNTVIKHIFSCPTSSQNVTFKSYGYHGINFVGTSGISEMSSKEMLHKMLYTEAFGKFSWTCRRSEIDLKIFCMDLPKSYWIYVATLLKNFRQTVGKNSLDSAQNKLYLFIFPTLQFANVSIGNLT